MTSAVSPSEDFLLSAPARGWLYRLVIVIAAAQGLANILTATVLYSPSRWPENRPPHTPMFSANDRSRWCTVWSLAERGTYQIDEIIRQPGWDTIDKVRYNEHFYSSKPPLLSTIAAGIYWVLHRTTGLDLLTSTHEAVQALLVILNWIPWVVALGLLARLVERYGRTDWSRLYAVAAAAFGTFLTTFLITFNNHTVAACSVVFALVPTLAVLIDGRREGWRFALAGFWGAFAVTNELPACVFGVALFALLARRSLRQTLVWFVPAALVPLAAFFWTNWLCTGGIKPFYASFGASGNDYYRYVIDGVPSYWMNPSAIDQGEASALIYLLHCTVGHHGIFSLSPIFLLSAVGWLTLPAQRGQPLRGVSALGLLLTLWLLAFYLLRTHSYNYGGVTSGLRWSFWLTPFWLLGLVPVLDRWGHRPGVRVVSAGFLAVSVFSAAFPHHNPWQPPWLQNLLGGLPATAVDEKPHARETWFELPATVPDDPREYWIELEGLSTDGVRHTLRLALEGASDDSRYRLVATISDGPDRDPEALRLLLDRRALEAEGGLPEAIVEPPAGNAERARAIRFLSGLPQPKPYVADRVRYLKTPLRNDAFRCEVASASILYRLRKDAPALRYRRTVWWSRKADPADAPGAAEVPFGIVQIEDTVSDPSDNAILHRQRFTAVRSGQSVTAAPQVP